MVCLYFLSFCPIYVHVSYFNILSMALKLDDIIVAKNKAKQLTIWSQGQFYFKLPH